MAWLSHLGSRGIGLELGPSLRLSSYLKARLFLDIISYCMAVEGSESWVLLPEVPPKPPWSKQNWFQILTNKEDFVEPFRNCLISSIILMQRSYSEFWVARSPRTSKGSPRRPLMFGLVLLCCLLLGILRCPTQPPVFYMCQCAHQGQRGWNK